jgi:WD40 repeat protein
VQGTDSGRDLAGDRPSDISGFASDTSANTPDLASAKSADTPDLVADGTSGTETMAPEAGDASIADTQLDVARDEPSHPDAGAPEQQDAGAVGIVDLPTASSADGATLQDVLSPNPDARDAVSFDLSGAIDITTDRGALDESIGFAVGSVSKLVADPQAGLLYALSGWSILVFDTVAKSQLTTVKLDGYATDIDLSPDGQYLVASLDGSKRIDVIDKRLWSATPVDTRADPEQVEVMNGGIAYYATLDQWTEIHEIDLTQGVSSDFKLNLYSAFEPDIELSAAGNRLFVAESGLSGSNIYELNLDVAPTRTIDQSKWDDGYGFDSPGRHVYLGPSGKHLYYAGHQLDATNLAHALGDTGTVFAEDAAATFAVSTKGIIDAQTLTTVTPFLFPVSSAALTEGDSELWYYRPDLSQIVYAKVADFLSGKTLGQAQFDAGPLGAYTFSKLVADPARPRLYGLDASKNLIVSIDSTSGATLRSLTIEVGAKDMVFDAASGSIFVAHSGMEIEQIDAATLSRVRFIYTPADNYQLALLSNGRIASINFDQWTTARILEVSTGIIDSSWQQIWEGALSATADGNTLFVGGTDTPDKLVRYDVSTGKMTGYSGGNAIASPSRGVLATPDGTSVYYGGYCLNGTGLTEVRYPQTDKIISITPNSALAVSSTTVYRVSDGTVVATLPTACSVQAISVDSRTLYCYAGSIINQVTLAGLQ